jgi:hypothetical protein
MRFPWPAANDDLERITFWHRPVAGRGEPGPLCQGRLSRQLRAPSELVHGTAHCRPRGSPATSDAATLHGGRCRRAFCIRPRCARTARILKTPAPRARLHRRKSPSPAARSRHGIRARHLSIFPSFPPTYRLQARPCRPPKNSLWLQSTSLAPPLVRKTWQALGPVRPHGLAHAGGIGSSSNCVTSRVPLEVPTQSVQYRRHR